MSESVYWRLSRITTPLNMGDTSIKWRHALAVKFPKKPTLLIMITMILRYLTENRKMKQMMLCEVCIPYRYE